MSNHFVAASLAIAVAAATANADDRPNILFLMADDHATHAVGAYQGRLAPLDPTPNIDRLARSGLRFRNAFCTNSICTPSRSTLLTGKYSHENGVYKFTALDPAQPTFPRLIRAAGYHTAMIGKSHVYSIPEGFDYWSLLPGWGKYHNPDFIEMDGRSASGLVEDGKRTNYPGYCDDVIGDKALAYLKSGRPLDRPFLLFCYFKAPHDDWQHAERYRNLYETIQIPEPDNLFDDHRGRSDALSTTTQLVGNAQPGHTFFPEATGHLQGVARKKAQYQVYLKKYLRCVRGIDDNVGRIMGYLQESGLERNTIVVYTSDQGMFLGEHGLYDKRFMYEEALRFPLIVRWPGRVASNSVNDDLVLNVDYAPTLLNIAGLPIPPDMQGRSFLPLLEARRPDDWRSSMYYRYYQSHFKTERHVGVRTKTHKLIYFDRLGQWELYDLAADPGEMKNLASDPSRAQLFESLKAELARLQADLKDDPGDIGDHPRTGR
jgi:arylsulfatase A-like enzyme